ncbi:MAG: DNA ligase D [Gemmataceae bacterium]
MVKEPSDLALYRAKRHFDKSPEPRGKKMTHRGALRFVVQKHQASRLHYDFRLELDGTLKSWAVPKGPSLNPADKRLAIMVEDHPLEYRKFEGAIPAGNYGAGTVIIWDEGTYWARAAVDSQDPDNEKLLRAGLEKGHLTFILEGRKLNGEFALIRLRKGKDNEWLLVKKADQYASTEDVTEQSRSIKSKRTLEQVAAPTGASGQGRKRVKPRPLPAAIRKWLKNAPAAEMPRQVRPMLATTVDAAFDRPGWLYEIKWDGYRAIAEVGKESVRLYSRAQKPLGDKFRPLIHSLERLGHEAVIDGEAVVLDYEGKARFQLLQNFQQSGKGTLVYYAFDLLYLDGRDLRKLPLWQRKEILAAILDGLPAVRLSEHVQDQGKAFFKVIETQGLEGMIAKAADSPYREGQRTGDWLKVKTHLRQEVVIGGYTDPKGSRPHMGALVLGVYEKNDLVYVGHTGSGFNDESLADVQKKLAPLVQRACPFKIKPRTNAPVHWIRPELVCEVSFQEWTEDGHLRHPIFEGLREDKAPTSVHREKPAAITQSEPIPVRGKSVERSNGFGKSPQDKRFGQTLSPKLTNLDKVYWPKEGYTKGQLIEYYRDVSSFILPYLRDRPESLHRHPKGIEGQSFFQKDVSKQPPPSWVETATIRSEGENREIRYVVCQNEATLLYMVNLGCIEINPWNSRVSTPDNPDYLMIDLDPEDVPFQSVIETAQAVHKLLDRIGAPNLCKTSGKRGMHIFVPLAAQYDYNVAKSFAELIANLVQKSLPTRTSVVRSPSRRQKRVYLDFLQNRRGQTIAAPYSVRPVPQALVSTPLKWSEVKPGLDPSKFTIRSMAKRLGKMGDLWKPVLGPGVNLSEAIERCSKM